MYITAKTVLSHIMGVPSILETVEKRGERNTGQDLSMYSFYKSE